MVRNFQRVIGDEARRQILEQEERLPDLLIACVGGGSNANWFVLLLYPFSGGRHGPKWSAWEAGGLGIEPEKARRAVSGAVRLVFYRERARIFYRDENGQIQLTHSVSAGPGLCGGWGRNTHGCVTKNRVEYTYATDDKALEAFLKLARLEGIIPALESAHAHRRSHSANAERWARIN